jgi:hypothetical protein
MAPNTDRLLSVSLEVLPAQSVVPGGSQAIDGHYAAAGSAVEVADRRAMCRAIGGSNAGRKCR